MKNVTMIDKMPPLILRVSKKCDVFVDWREGVANGDIHPLELHEDVYTRIVIGKLRIDTDYPQYSNAHGLKPSEYLEEHEQEPLKHFLRSPAISWAVDNSFDGVYIARDKDHANLMTRFIFSVYMKSEHATFWNLKYSGI